jgi:aspartate aminotransferase
VCQDANHAKVVLSQIKVIIRANYSNPPKHGALIVATVLGDQNLYEEWKAELNDMSGRIKLMRQMLYDAINANGTPGDWDNIITQIGMFSYTGLNRNTL